jgi:hypothetical protein
VNAIKPVACSLARALLLGLALAALPSARGAEASPIDAAARALACGETVAEVERGLVALEAAPTARFGVPDESLAGVDLELDSGTYDNLLDALARARQRFPELAQRIHVLIERWDFCALTALGERWDLAVREEPPAAAPEAAAPPAMRVVRRRPTRMSPLLGSGFAAWSLLPRSAGGRPRFSEGDTIAEAAGSVAQSLQCGRDTALQLTPSGSLPMAMGDEEEVDGECLRPPPPSPPTAAGAPAHDPRGAAGGAAEARPRRPARAAVTAEDSREVASADTRDASATLPGTISAALTASATGNLNLGTGVSLAPWPNTFVRAGLSWRLVTAWDEAAASASDAEPSWSWGVGYDDWHPGTFSLQLNHWGPLRRLEKKAIEGAVATLGYKVPLPRRWAEWLSLRADLSTPLTWSPAFGAGVAFKLPRSFFFSLGLSQKLLERTSPTWSYVLGRSRWKAGTLALVLANYGPNRLDQLNLRGLSLTASWSWSL